MPQFDPSVFPAQIFWLAVVFGLFWLIMARMGLPRVEQIYKDREQRIGDDLDAAERMNNEAKAIRDAYQATLAKARDDAAATTGKAREAATRRLAEAQAEVDAKLDKRQREAEADIARARNEALDEMHAISVDVAKELLAQFSVTGNTNKLKASVKRELAGVRAEEAQ
ncbi:F-type H+-transporting ATPase subunit b [Rhodothalassium salexigens DSM 2132]|uniref:ATP synthase subunit b n=1 Tax=Rhodothalassium salexigens DSM 2132 TaxID=1188247 RepID=A0A4R2PHR6_RHOSA|nr:F0F1 ATP synthase subunit B' [Rhodothalassium salexigens]MBB4211921.1 F-type H+-transporting ATPase subunit b [Rhodothalassium salexigens DSM 2132]MBK1639271.1 hypothetical protein [Rhodothalassium salexigens DSM 2132]TCP33495.1 F-type H+-transporting ATPase subunit b [Rhodothalassium salexigens DSM 2132]